MSKMDKKKQLLLIDDNEVFLTVAQNMLKNDYEVVTRTSGKDAIELLYKKEFPDIILLDILMPKMDGWETFKRIKTIGFLINIPIVFITSLKDEESKKHAYELGANGYIRKPFEKEDLMEKLDAILQERA